MRKKQIHIVNDMTAPPDQQLSQKIINTISLTKRKRKQ
jgi:hypothetical protein